MIDFRQTWISDKNLNQSLVGRWIDLQLQHCESPCFQCITLEFLSMFKSNGTDTSFMSFNRKFPEVLMTVIFGIFYRHETSRLTRCFGLWGFKLSIVDCCLAPSNYSRRLKTRMKINLTPRSAFSSNPEVLYCLRKDRSVTDSFLCLTLTSTDFQFWLPFLQWLMRLFWMKEKEKGEKKKNKRKEEK